MWFPAVPGSSPGWDQGFPREDSIGEKDRKRKRQGKNFAAEKTEERKEADIPWFMQKANKAPARDLLCSHRPQASSRIVEGAPP